MIVEFPFFEAILMDQPRNFDVVAAIFGNLEKLAFLEPLYSPETFSRLFDAERRSRY